MDYKQTLNIPKVDFEMKGNLPTKEPKIQENWRALDIYGKVLEKNKAKQIFLLHDGPPYANGNIHIGHALNKTLKDIIVRYKNLSGFYAPFIPGWDTHGLPIELAMIKKQGSNVNNQNPIERRKSCYQYALEQIDIQKGQFLRIGMLSDFEKIYRTLDHEFEIKQLELFLTMIKKGLIFRDKKPVYWSWSSQSALAEAEIEYKDVQDPSIYITFKALDNNILPSNTSFIIWTTTPWTIPANVAIAVHPKLEYVVFKYKDNNYVVSNTQLDKLLSIFGWDKKDVEIIKIVSGEELENLNYHHPFLDRISPIILAKYVSDIDGTGLVHNASGFGIDDYLACKEYNIGVYSPIDNYGKYDATISDKELEGVFYLDANEIIINRLKNAQSLVKLETISHRVACDWRTKKPVIYRATEQWFVNLKEISEDIIYTLNNDVNSPFKKNTERMIDMINNRSEWCISRQRIWGVPIPIIFRDRIPLLEEDLIANIINVLDKNGVNAWYELPVEKFLTDKYLNLPGEYVKENDIMDVWFDSGSTHQMFKVWGLNYPADLYLEGSDQYRGWFNSSLITGTIQNKKSPYKAILQHGFTLDENGNKMSKSIGNVIDPLKIFDIYGADVFRLWVASSEYTEDQRFGENIIKQVAEVYRRIRNTLLKYSLSIISDFKKENIQTDFTLEDKYILDRLNEVLNKINEAYEIYKFSDVVKLINNFTIELSTWYFDLIKDEIYCGYHDSLRKYQIQTVVYNIVSKLLIALAPIIPHTADEAYQFLPFKSNESIHLEDWYQIDDKKYLTAEQTIGFKDFFILKDMIYAEIEKARQNNIIKKTNMVDVSLYELNSIFDLETLKTYLNVAKIQVIENQEKKVIITPTEYQRCERCWNHYKNELMHDDTICNRCYDVIVKEKKGL